MHKKRARDSERLPRDQTQNRVAHRQRNTQSMRVAGRPRARDKRAKDDRTHASNSEKDTCARKSQARSRSPRVHEASDVSSQEGEVGRGEDGDRDRQAHPPDYSTNATTDERDGAQRDGADRSEDHAEERDDRGSDEPGASVATTSTRTWQSCALGDRDERGEGYAIIEAEDVASVALDRHVGSLPHGLPKGGREE